MSKFLELGTFPPVHDMLTDAEYKNRLFEIGINRIAATNAMRHAIRKLTNLGATTEAATFNTGHSVHGDLTRIEDHTRVIHIELNPNTPSRRIGYVTLTEQDSDELQRVRDAGLTSTGAEGTAITKYVLPDEAHLGQANNYQVLLTGDAIAGLLEQVLFSDPQINKPRGLARIRKLFSR
jgi:hypothetical protein